MKPIKFKEQNCTYAENQPEYEPLPAYKCAESGDVISCWKLSLVERIIILFTGKLWLDLLVFDKPLQPIYMTTDKENLFLYSEKKLNKIVKRGVRLFYKLRKENPL